MALTRLARNLRKSQTDVEQILWLQLRNRRFLNYKFRRQCPIGNYIVDFICVELSLIIELDGSQHGDLFIEDTERTLCLNQRGFKVVRFWNNEVMENLDAVLESIKQHAEKQAVKACSKALSSGRGG